MSNKLFKNEGDKNMNSYQMIANTYKNILKRDNPTGAAKEEIERKITAHEILANTDRQTQFELFNSSAFNDICKGYFLMALYNAGIDDETRREIMQEMKWLLDSVTAEQADRYYNEHP